tara:strand:+ start:708 stop:848 length:141 start_codon:yes stop_codon:yes gene_type:complete
MRIDACPDGGRGDGLILVVVPADGTLALLQVWQVRYTTGPVDVDIL